MSVVVTIIAFLVVVALIGIVVQRSRSTAATRNIERAALATRQLTVLQAAFAAFPPNAYVAGSEYQEWRSTFPQLAQLDVDPGLANYLPVEVQPSYRSWIEFLRGESKSIEEHNNRYADSRKSNCSSGPKPPVTACL